MSRAVLNHVNSQQTTTKRKTITITSWKLSSGKHNGAGELAPNEDLFRRNKSSDVVWGEAWVYLYVWNATDHVDWTSESNSKKYSGKSSSSLDISFPAPEEMENKRHERHHQKWGRWFVLIAAWHFRLLEQLHFGAALIFQHLPERAQPQVVVLREEGNKQRVASPSSLFVLLSKEQFLKLWRASRMRQHAIHVFSTIFTGGAKFSIIKVRERDNSVNHQWIWF